ncbi:amino acid permease [Streptomyces sp. NPDC046316]|uniref:amino acid permease n=1 Tax=Streptomyces sp. NPDC046316 TaxID=3154494 RepID=UPI0033D50496
MAAHAARHQLGRGKGRLLRTRHRRAQGGRGVVLSFVIAVGVAGLGALCYVELAGAAPVSGSTYAYAYASLGEGAAYLDAWCLVLEYGVAVSTAAVSWGRYLNEVSDTVVGVTLPDAISGPPGADGLADFVLPETRRLVEPERLP